MACLRTWVFSRRCSNVTKSAQIGAVCWLSEFFGCGRIYGVILLPVRLSPGNHRRGDSGFRPVEFLGAAM